MAKATKKKNEAKSATNGASKPEMERQQPEATAKDEEVAKKIAALRSQVRESFGKVVMAMMTQPRYKHLTIADLNHLVLEPLTRDRIAMAYGRNTDAGAPDMAGMAIWASVSEEVDLKIREQIKSGVFPIRLSHSEWVSGDINWLLDVIAIDQKTAGQVIGNFRQVVKDGELRVHPIITRLVDEDTLAKMQKAQATPTDA